MSVFSNARIDDKCFFCLQRDILDIKFPSLLPSLLSATPPSPPSRVSLTQQGTVPIPGARTLAQAQENLGAMVRTHARNLLHEPTLLLSVPFRLLKLRRKRTFCPLCDGDLRAGDYLLARWKR